MLKIKNELKQSWSHMQCSRQYCWAFCQDADFLNTKAATIIKTEKILMTTTLKL